jgi:KDO2-lipid IV(A) lauroyltransferase
MAKKRSRLGDYAVYLVVRCFSCILQILSPPAALGIARSMASLAYRVDRRHREVALENLRYAFPGRYGEEELRGMVLDVYRHFARMLVEMLLIHRKLGRNCWRRYLGGSGEERFLQLHRSGRPILVVTAHFGSWELASHWLRMIGVKAHLVARPLDNPHLDKLVRGFRERTGHKVLGKNGGLSQMRAVLAAGGTLCTLIDQDAGHRGIFVDFFGRPASTHKAVAYLAQRTGAVIFVVGAQNNGSLLHYTARLTDVIMPEDYAGDADATRAITQRVTTAVERLVLHDPRQYMWLHRRWKHQPTQTQLTAA